MLYTLNLYNDVYQLFFSKSGKDSKKGNTREIEKE